MPTIQIGDISIHYDIHGEGEPILLIAGYTSSATGWFMQLPALSENYRVIAFDNRGTGQSDKPDIPYTMDEMADDAIGLLDALGIDAAHICGVSMGGRIAQSIAIRHPRKVISLILACTGCGGPHDITGDPAALKSLSPPENAQRQTLDETEAGPWSTMLSKQFVDNNPDIMAQIIAASMAFPAPASTYKNHATANRSHDAYDRLPEIKSPTLIMSGDVDVIVPVENSKLLAEKIPNSELVILTGMGHCFKWEAAEKFNRTVLEFIGRHPKPV